MADEHFKLRAGLEKVSVSDCQRLSAILYYHMN